jgi:pimeloyl-ACP methyl ester carboxylesterase
MFRLLQFLEIWERLESRIGNSSVGTKLVHVRSGCAIVGASMGGAIATAFAAAYPTRVSKLVLLAPAGLLPDVPSAVRAVRRVMVRPWRQRLLERLCGCCFRSFIRSQFDATRWSEHIAEDAVEPDFLHAYVSTLKHFPFTTMQLEYSEVGRNPALPVLLFFGDKDVVVPFECHKHIIELIPHAVFRVLTGRGHEITIWEPVGEYDAVVEEICSFVGLRDGESLPVGSVASPNLAPRQQPAVGAVDEDSHYGGS